MRAVCVIPRTKDSLNINDVEIPERTRGECLVEVQRVGICGTDRDIIAGFYGEAPPNQRYLILGHESLCRISETADSVGEFKKNDLVVPTVRRSCPENCLNCRSGESDMCLTGHYLEHGIKRLNGFSAEFAVTDADYVVKLPDNLSEVGVLLEPLTIVEKGRLQTYLLQQARMKWNPTRALVLGAGPVGILGTAILRLQGLEVDTVATRSKESLKARLVEMTGATYINAKEMPLDKISKTYDIVFEITGSPTIALQAQDLIGTNGIVCYLGIYKMQTDSEDEGKIFTDLVLGNKVHFGSVNANKDYFQKGVEDLGAIRTKWPGLLEKMITRQVNPERFQDAYMPESEEDIKTVILFRK